MTTYKAAKDVHAARHGVAGADPVTPAAIGAELAGAAADAQAAAALDAAAQIDAERVTERALQNSTFGRKAHVVVGPNGDYATLTAALAAYPTGSVNIELTAGAHTLAAPLTVAGVKNVTIRGQGREITTVTCTTQFIVATANADQWTIQDLGLVHAAGANTDDGIDVDYPRRWLVARCYISGFGGSSIHYRGGIHSAIRGNYILAKDSTNTNGYAGIHVEQSVSAVVATSFISEGNYVGSGKQFGIFALRTNHGCLFMADTVELCAVGMRFELCTGELHSPYTESNTVGIQLHDSLMPVSNPREFPVLTWASQAGVDRRPLLIGRNYINPGKAIIFGPGTGAAADPALAPSIRWYSGSPEGVAAGVVGSLWIRTDGGAGSTLYVKETGTGNTGWVAK